MKDRLWRWAPALAWAGAIFAVSARSTVALPSVSHADKIAHFGAYLVLGLCLAWGQRTSRLSLLAVAVLGILYGASDEVHQLFVPGRDADWLDWVADSVGICAGVPLGAWLLDRFASRSAPPSEPTPVSHG